MVLGILIGAGILDIVPEVWVSARVGCSGVYFCCATDHEGPGAGECETAGARGCVLALG